MLSQGRESIPYLICHSNTRLCALPLEHVAETMRSLPLEPLAAMPPFVLGVSVIRGSPVPVVDAATLLGSATHAAPRRLVALKVGQRRIGFAVDGVLGVRGLPAASLEEIPPLLRGAGEATVAAITTLDSQLLLVLESARIVPESVWAALESSGPPA